jgi:putative glutamine amidotransferase
MGTWNLNYRKTACFIAIFLAVFIITPHASGQPAPLKIGLSKASPNYVNWLKRTDPGIQTVDLYAMSIPAALQQLNQCSGLVLTGGEDVWPGRYGRLSDTLRCTEMNRHRDSLDMALIEEALTMRMPVVGVCRGNQILNVYFGGTLVIDIPADIGRQTIHQCDDYLNCFHSLDVEKKSLLYRISRCDSARVTTNHHQAVDRLGSQLAANAHSGDNLIEGIEWKYPDDKSFLLGVQWHPERMEHSHPLSTSIAQEFLLQATSFSYKQINIK